MKEHTLYSRIKKHFTPCHAIRITDRMQSGIPDFNICKGGEEYWIEVKFKKAWPVRPLTPVHLDFRMDQALWLVERKKNGGNAWLCAVVGREEFWFNDHFIELADGLPQEAFRRLSVPPPG